MGNILIDMMGLLSRKRVVKTYEDTDMLVLGRRPNADDSIFNTPKMHNELISLKDLRAQFGTGEGEVTGTGTTNTLPLWSDGPNGVLGDSMFSQNAGATQANVTGTITCDGLDLGDNEVIRLGDSQDLKIYHNGTDSYIENEVGDLIIQNDDDGKDIIFNCDDGASGTAAYFKLDGSASETVFTRNIRFEDGERAKFGTGSDLQIYHDTDNSYIQDDGTGDLLISTNGASVQINKGSGMSPTSVETMAKFITDGAVELYYDNSKKLETTTGGVDLFGTINAIGTLSSTGQASLSTNGPISVADLGGNSSTSSQFNIISTFTGDSLVTATNRLTLKANNVDGIKINNTGEVQFNQYGTGTFTGTAAYNLSVDSSGNVIETAAGGGGGGGVTSIIAGTNVTISPVSGTGDVTINASGGGGGGISETKGNWTPQVIAMSNTTTPEPGWNISSYAINQGRWMRHGTLVQCEFNILIQVANISKSAGNNGFLTIQGWPYDAGNSGLYQDARTVQCTGFDVIATNFTYTYNTALVGDASINLNTPSVASNGVHGIVTIKESNIPSSGSLVLKGVLAYETNDTTLNPGATIQT